MFQQTAYTGQPSRDSKRHSGLSDYDLALSRGMQLLTSAAGLDTEQEDDKEQHVAHQHAMQTMLSSNVSATSLSNLS